MISYLNHSGVFTKGLKNICTSVSLTIQLGVWIRWLPKSLQVWTCIDWFCFRAFEVTITLTEDSLLSIIWGLAPCKLGLKIKLISEDSSSPATFVVLLSLYHAFYFIFSIEIILRWFFFCFYFFPYIYFSLVQSLSCVQLSATPWTVAHQASLFITNSQSLLKLMSTESVMPSNHSSFVVPFSYDPQFFPASGSFQMSQLFTSGGQSIGVSASTSVFPMNNQD